jgi:hypothetical protein
MVASSSRLALLQQEQAIEHNRHSRFQNGIHTINRSQTTEGFFNHISSLERYSRGHSVKKNDITLLFYCCGLLHIS